MKKEHVIKAKVKTSFIDVWNYSPDKRKLLPCVETVVICENLVNKMTADVLAPCIARSPAAILFSV